MEDVKESGRVAANTIPPGDEATAIARSALLLTFFLSAVYSSLGFFSSEVAMCLCAVWLCQNSFIVYKHFCQKPQ